MASFAVVVFQSTLLIRGATLLAGVLTKNQIISIHAPHTRSDEEKPMNSNTTIKFQSTLLIRGATRCQCGGSDVHPHFNPRSSYEERPPREDQAGRRGHFNPRSSYEERQMHSTPKVAFKLFQSTLLIRGATISVSASAPFPTFQSTLLIRGATGARDPAR